MNSLEHQYSSRNKNEDKILNLNLIDSNNYNNITYNSNSNISNNKNEDISNSILNLTKNIRKNIKFAKQDFDIFLRRTDIQKQETIIFDKDLDRKMTRNTKIETEILPNIKIETESPIEINSSTMIIHNKETETSNRNNGESKIPLDATNKSMNDVDTIAPVIKNRT